ncbi:hypothetical protein HAX54_025213 [Datura stramonium]|uniref:Uncharacterized protein n=1 Tax=Datura stramonium TaxID=4076 RepID=A0ABS8S610_DATST|nr:hypothetical protein [Datura stramonium]
MDLTPESNNSYGQRKINVLGGKEKGHLQCKSAVKTNWSNRLIDNWRGEDVNRLLILSVIKDVWTGSCVFLECTRRHWSNESWPCDNRDPNWAETELPQKILFFFFRLGFLGPSADDFVEGSFVVGAAQIFTKLKEALKKLVA